MRCVVVLLAGILGLTSCGSPEPRTASAVVGLKEYTPEEAALFGDTLASGVFGLPDQSADAGDEKLAARVQHADTVVPVRISTVTRESLAGTHGFVLILTPTEAPLAGRPPEEPLELRIKLGGPALARVATVDTRLVGARMIVFLRKYAEAGEPALHFHGEADTPGVRNRLKSVKKLDAPSSGVQTSP
jgi:hypothetical protein